MGRQALWNRWRARRRGRRHHRAAGARARPRRRAAQRPRGAARAASIRDTRESGEMLEAALAAGLASAGAEVALGGVLPTPAAPLLARRHGFDLAAVISASHNPYADNGIKFFGGDGFKLSDETEQEIELHLDEDITGGGTQIGRIATLAGTARGLPRASSSARFGGLALDGPRRRPRLRQRRDLQRRARDLPPPRRARDRARGRARRAQHQRRLRLDAPRRARRGGARRRPRRSASPSTATATACSRSTATAQIVDGDELLALAAVHLHGAGRLAGDGVVVTVMTNFGFHARDGGGGDRRSPTTAVGDRYVLAELRERGWTLGGEQSGHIIEMGFGPSGRRDRLGAARARGARRRRPARARGDREAPAAARQRAASRDRDALAAGGRPSTRRSRARRRRSRAAGACSCARAAPSRSCA